MAADEDELRARWDALTAEGDATQTYIADTDDFLQPTQFGPVSDETEVKVTLGELLGKGGHSWVHSAIQTSLSRTVAVKSARMDLAEPDSRRLLHEARVMGALEHPNIIPVYDIDRAEGQPRIVLKRIEGRVWSDCMRNPPSADPLAWNLRILVSVCHALELAHSRGILHRDIKPQNVMLGAFGEVYLMDWGLAVSLNPRDRGRFAMAVDQDDPVGTPAYLAPEMVFGAGRDLCPETDVFLLGGTLYHLISGRPPRSGSAHEAIAEILMGKEPAWPEDAPAPLVELGRAMLADVPSQRPQVAEVRAQVVRFLENRGLDRLVDRAMDQLVALEQAIADEEPSEVVKERFAACRSVFEAARDATEGRTDVEEGARRAVLTMVEYALHDGDEQTARFLVGGLDDPPPETLAWLDSLAEKQAQEEQELARLREEVDPVVGAGIRIALLVSAALVWGGVPILLSLTMERSYLRGLIMITLVSLLTIVLVAAASRFLWHTRTNRKLAGVILLGPLVSAPAFLGAWLAGLPPEFGGVFVMLVLSAMSAAGTFLEDVRLLPSTIVFFLGFWIVCVWPQALFAALITCTLFMALNGLAGWGPGWVLRELGRD